MKITADRARLADALSWTAQIVPRRPQDPRDAMLRIVATADGLTITATDRETWATAHVPAEIHDAPDEPIMLPGARAAALVGAMTGPSIVIEQSDPGKPVTLVAGRSRYTLTAGVGDGPAAPEPGPAQARIDAREMVAAWSRVAPMVSDQEALVNITSVLVHLDYEAEAIVLRASDRYRAADISLSADVKSDQLIMAWPKRFGPMLKGMSGTVEIGANGGTVTITDGHRTATMRQAGETKILTNVGAMFDTRHEGQVPVECDTAALIGAVKRASLAAVWTNVENKDASASQHVTISTEDGTLTVEAADNEAQGTETIDADATGGVRTVFNARYLIEGLSGFTSPRVQMLFETKIENARPCRFIGIGGDGFRYTAMPVKK